MISAVGFVPISYQFIGVITRACQVRRGGCHRVDAVLRAWVVKERTMDWVGIVVSVGLPFGTAVVASLVDPRHVSRRSELGKAMKHVGRRDRREVTKALRDGRAVSDPRLASLAAAFAKEEMERSDYRGPPRRQEIFALILGAAAVGLLAAFARHESGVVPAFVGGYCLVVVWVVGLRRLVPSHRDSTDRLLTAYRANVALAERSGPGEFERVRFGMP